MWAIFSRYFLLDTFSLACANWIEVPNLHRFLANYKSPQQLDCRQNWIYVYRVHQNDHPSNIDLWIPLQLSAKLSAHASRKSYHNCISEKSLFGWLGFSPSFGKDFDDEVATEQLTTVVDVTFCHTMIRKYPNSLGDHEMH